MREAVALDTSFAMAYRALGITMSNFGLPQASIDSALSKAYLYRDRLTERERYLAEAAYFGRGPGRDRGKAAAAYRALLAVDPQNYVALNNLGDIDLQRRQYAAADTLFRRAVAAGNTGSLELGNIIEAELGAGNTAGAQRDLATLRERYPDAIQGPGFGFTVLYAQNRLDAIDTALARDRASPRPELRSFGEFLQSQVALLRGQPSVWARATADARRTEETRGVPQPPLDDSVTAVALDITLRAQPARGAARLDALLSRVPLHSVAVLDRPYFEIAELYALAARPDRARAILGEYAADVKDTATLRDNEPQMHAARGEIALAEHRPQDALNEFARADTASDGYPVICGTCYPLNGARAYDEAGNRDSAIVLYERYEAVYLRRYQPRDPLFRSLGYKRLGELYENRGDIAHAVANYQQFLALWKDADPDLQPVVADVRRRLAKLGAEPARVVPAAQPSR